MAKTESVEIGELKKLLAAGKLVFGAESALKLLRSKKVQKVFLAANCRQSVRDDVLRLCRLASVECVELSQGSEEIGVLCKKPFAVSVVGVL